MRDSHARMHGLPRDRASRRSGRLTSTGRAIHDLAASAPILPQETEGNREAHVKDFLLLLEAPVQFKDTYSREHCKTLLDVQAAAEEIIARWGM